MLLQKCEDGAARGERSRGRRPARVHSRQPSMVTISFQKDHHDTSQDMIENEPVWSSSKWKDAWLKF